MRSCVPNVGYHQLATCNAGFGSLDALAQGCQKRGYNNSEILEGYIPGIYPDPSDITEFRKFQVKKHPLKPENPTKIAKIYNYTPAPNVEHGSAPPCTHL